MVLYGNCIAWYVYLCWRASLRGVVNDIGWILLLNNQVTSTTYNRGQLIIILLVPVLVVVSSTLLYLSGWLLPKETSNQGYLLTPVLATTDFGLTQDPISQDRHWQLIQFSPECTQSCFDKLYEQRQVHIALGKRQQRVQRLLVTNSDISEKIRLDYPDLQLSSVPVDSVMERLKTRLPESHLSLNPIFVADPFGNIMLYFTPEQDYRAQLSDLKKLLRLSTIG